MEGRQIGDNQLKASSWWYGGGKQSPPQVARYNFADDVASFYYGWKPYNPNPKNSVVKDWYQVIGLCRIYLKKNHN